MKAAGWHPLIAGELVMIAASIALDPFEHGGPVGGLVAAAALPLAMAFVSVALLRLSARTDDAMRAPPAVLWLFAGTCIVLHGLMLLIAREPRADWDQLVGLTAGALLVLVGFAMTRVPPNPVLGLRVPWTLRCEVTWRKSNRLAGWLFVATGVSTAAVAAASQDPLWLIVTLFGLPVVAVAGLVYSRRVYRQLHPE